MWQYDILIVFKLLAVWLYPIKGPVITVMHFTSFKYIMLKQKQHC